MTIKEATPYLILNGHAVRAVSFYEKALDARVELLQRFGDMDGSCPEARRSLVMHAALKLDDATIMLSDGPGDGRLPEPGTVSIALSLTDADTCRRRFDALAATGKVVQPLFDAPWGALFGVVRDEFNVSWMFNCAKSGK